MNHRTSQELSDLRFLHVFGKSVSGWYYDSVWEEIWMRCCALTRASALRLLHRRHGSGGGPREANEVAGGAGAWGLDYQL